MHLYSNAQNKQEERKAMVQLEIHHLIAIKETWWDELHNWSTMIESYNVFRRGK